MWCIPDIRIAVVAAAALAAATAGCGFRPLHGQGGGGASRQLAKIQIAQIPDRIGQKLHNLLLQRLTPKGPPARPDYVLSVSVNETKQSLAIRRDETATRANLTVTAAFSLSQSIGKGVFVGRAVSINSYNILQSDFATLSTENDARDRALRVLAQEIRGRIAAALINPALFVGPEPVEPGRK